MFTTGGRCRYPLALSPRLADNASSLAPISSPRRSTMTAWKCLALTLFVLGSCLAAAAGTLAEEDKSELKKGDKAPSFEATDDQGNTWKSSEHVGKKVLVVYFYPADFTRGCTKQACTFRDDMGKLTAK